MRNVVLVVDNDEDMRDIVRTALSHAGFDTLGASSAKQALSFLDYVLPTAIVLDFLLADMDGVELAKVIRWRSSCAQTPMVMLTGAPEVAEQQLSKAGLDVKVFAKPVALDVVTRNIEYLCGPLVH